MIKHLIIVSAFALFAETIAGAAGREAILKDVKSVDVAGLPGPICLFDDAAFPLLMAGHEPVAAASTAKGRVVLLGHDGYLKEFSLNIDDTRKLMANAIRWAGGGAEKITVVTRGAANLGESFKAEGFSVLNEPRGANWLPEKAAGVVAIVHPAKIDEADAKALAKHLENGGGLIAAMPGWGWRQLHPGKTLDRDLPLNRTLAAAGLAFADGTTTRPENGRFAPAARPALADSRTAILKVESWLAGGAAPGNDEAEAIRAAIRRLEGSAPAEFAEPLRKKLAEALAKSTGRIPVPTAKKPLGPNQGAERLLLSLSMKEQSIAHPASAEFPGAVPANAKRVERSHEVEITSKGTICNGVGVSAKAEIWHSTGLYAAPGEAVSVIIPANAVGKLGLRIGAHSDTLWHLKSWQRAPEITVRKPIDQIQISAMNPFGGLVYITAPPGLELGKIIVTVKNAIEAPLYILGKTTPEQWAAMKTLDAPWAEIASKKVIFTIPSRLARTIDDPAEILAFWDRVMDHQADLTVLPRERGRAERIVHDVQISAGYMHSGYPIMCPLNEASRAMDIKRVLREGAWGYFHELGHNHQQREWTFDGTTEVTCNLYSLYCYEKLCPDAPLHESIRPEAIKKHLEAYRKAGSKFEVWKQEPFTALIMYKQLRDAFGWEAYQKAFRAYRDGKLKPTDDDAERDEWLIQISKATGKNLAPFFEKWGVPVREAAKKAVADLPTWEAMP